MGKVCSMVSYGYPLAFYLFKLTSFDGDPVGSFEGDTEGISVHDSSQGHTVSSYVEVAKEVQESLKNPTSFHDGLTDTGWPSHT